MLLLGGGSVFEVMKTELAPPSSWFIDQTVKQGVCLHDGGPRCATSLDVHACQIASSARSTHVSRCPCVLLLPDGSMMVASRVDPLFLLLPALEASSSSMSPLDTILSFAKCSALPLIARECGVSETILSAVCDCSGQVVFSCFLTRPVPPHAPPLLTVHPCLQTSPFMLMFRR
jgi:hypothetical protein